MPILPAEILANPDKYQGKTIPVNSGYITPADIEKELSKATNNTIRYRKVLTAWGVCVCSCCACISQSEVWATCSTVMDLSIVGCGTFLCVVQRINRLHST